MAAIAGCVAPEPVEVEADEAARRLDTRALDHRRRVEHGHEGAVGRRVEHDGQDGAVVLVGRPPRGHGRPRRAVGPRHMWSRPSTTSSTYNPFGTG